MSMKLRSATTTALLTIQNVKPLFSLHIGLVYTDDQSIQILSHREIASVFTDESEEPECCELSPLFLLVCHPCFTSCHENSCEGWL